MDVGFVFLLTALLQLVQGQDTCKQVDFCTCKFDDGTQISLSTLASTDGIPRFNFTKATTSTYYYAYNPCKGFDYAKPCIGVAACQRSEDSKEIFDVGEVSSAKFNPQGTTITYTATVEATVRITTVHLDCDASATDPVFTAQDIVGQTNYAFHLKTCLACRQGCPAGLSPGSILCIVFSVLVILYVVVGVLFLKFVRGAEGKELVPNYDFWTDLPLLIKDGVLFVGRGCKAETDNYEQI